MFTPTDESTSPPGGGWYFAYGANMSTRVLVGRRGVRVTSAEAAHVDSYELAFDLAGIPWIEPAFASVRATVGARMEGVLFRVSDEDFAVITRTESARYRWIEVRAAAAAAGTVTARTLQNRTPTAGLIPSRRYLSLLVEGAREHGLSRAYVDRLERHPSHYVPFLSPLVERIPGAAMQMGRALRRISRRP